ncbi:hypothetical protein M0805_001988 [Coniferiporia weirii]|nr:hypothetical protein M0805_001988 [Coniferiporia weirii]
MPPTRHNKGKTPLTTVNIFKAEVPLSGESKKDVDQAAQSAGLVQGKQPWGHPHKQPTAVKENLTSSIEGKEDEHIKSEDDSLYEEEPSEMDIAKAAVLELAYNDANRKRQPHLSHPFSYTTYNTDEDFDEIFNGNNAKTLSNRSESVKSQSMDEFEVWVFDGQALTSMKVRTDHTFFVLLMNAARIMKLPHTTIILGYDAPWCKLKPGQKPEMRYLQSDDDLAELVKRRCDYVKDQQLKKKPTRCEIKIRNINDQTQAQRGSGRAVNQEKGLTKGAVAAVSTADEAKTAVTKALAVTVQEIKKHQQCDKHDRLCYVKYNGDHGLYTHENVTAHTKLVFSGVKGMSTKEVPVELRLLDFVKLVKLLPDQLICLARDDGVEINLGLALHVCCYVEEDVLLIKGRGGH